MIHSTLIFLLSILHNCDVSRLVKTLNFIQILSNFNYPIIKTKKKERKERKKLFPMLFERKSKKFREIEF